MSSVFESMVDALEKGAPPTHLPCAKRKVLMTSFFGVKQVSEFEIHVPDRIGGKVAIWRPFHHEKIDWWVQVEVRPAAAGEEGSP